MPDFVFVDEPPRRVGSKKESAERVKRRSPGRAQVVDGVLECSLCLSMKPISEFSTSSANSTGFRSRCKVCRNSSWRTAYAATEDARFKHWAVKLLDCYSLSFERYLEMLEAQNGVCTICKQPETVVLKGQIKRLAVDHDHTCCSGKKSCGECVRALLCTRCNMAVGFLESSAADPLDFVSYLTGHLNA